MTLYVALVELISSFGRVRQFLPLVKGTAVGDVQDRDFTAEYTSSCQHLALFFMCFIHGDTLFLFLSVVANVIFCLAILGLLECSIHV